MVGVMRSSRVAGEWWWAGGAITTGAVEAFSRTAAMPSTAALIVANVGVSATAVPSPAVSRERNVPSPYWMISIVPAIAVVFLPMHHCPAR